MTDPVAQAEAITRRHGVRRLDLCSGYDAATLVFGAAPVAVAETDPHASALHHQHHPDVPNLGDITTADWTDLASEVDLITAGFPCQPISQAGQQKGIDDDRWLWPDVARAVRDVRPGWVFLENVPRLLTINDGDAMAAVMHDLAVLGFDAEWGTVAASDVGACHRRNRWWCLARHPDRAPGAAPGGLARRPGPVGAPGTVEGTRGPDRQPGPVDLLPTPTTVIQGANPPDNPNVTLATAVETLIPTPTTSDAKGPSPGHEGTTAEAIEALLPTPVASYDGKTVEESLPGPWDALAPWPIEAWQQYGPAIDRHEHTFARPAPSPVIDNPKARKGVSLNPVFVEWMMGLPEGWVTGRGLPRTAELRALGNGWVPAQARAALDVLAGHMTEEIAA